MSEEFKHDCLIIGGDSRIGLGLNDALTADGYDTARTTRQDIEWNDGTIYFLDLGRPHTALPLARITYFCAAIARFAECEQKPEYAQWVNATGAGIVAENIVGRGGKVVLLSSAAVETQPTTVYGTTKANAEKLFLVFGPQAAIFRFGPIAFPGRQVYQSGRYEPLMLSDIVEHLKSVVEQWISGVHCVTAPRRHSLLRRVNG